MSHIFCEALPITPLAVETYIAVALLFLPLNYALCLRRLHPDSRYMERGVYDGAPRYRNPNNLFMFRHTLGRSEELGITRQTCLPESELVGEDVESAATTAALSLGREVSGKIGMDFSRLVKTSLQSINLDRQVGGTFRKTKNSCKASLLRIISFSSAFPSSICPLTLPFHLSSSNYFSNNGSTIMSAPLSSWSTKYSSSMNFFTKQKATSVRHTQT